MGKSTYWKHKLAFAIVSAMKFTLRLQPRCNLMNCGYVGFKEKEEITNAKWPTGFILVELATAFLAMICTLIGLVGPKSFIWPKKFQIIRYRIHPLLQYTIGCNYLNITKYQYPTSTLQTWLALTSIPTMLASQSRQLNHISIQPSNRWPHHQTHNALKLACSHSWYNSYILV